jgi:hypothetical protein
MTFTEQEVEWIVVEVIRRLGIAGVAGGGAADNRELRLADKVITMRTIEGKLDDVRRIVVSAQAVITPSVRDELRRRQIQVHKH